MTRWGDMLQRSWVKCDGCSRYWATAGPQGKLDEVVRWAHNGIAVGHLRVKRHLRSCLWSFIGLVYEKMLVVGAGNVRM